MRFIIITCLFLFFHSILFSHPVTFKNGIATSIVSGMATDAYINYSVSSKSSYGLRSHQLSDQINAHFYFIQKNTLLKRWHFFDAQANFYLISALAYESHDSQISPCSRFLFDYENRIFYSSIQAEFMMPGNDRYARYRSRLGIAPYKHDYTSVSTWFMIQFEHISYDSNHTQWMPIYRGFYKRFLWEFGYNGNESFFQFMVHI